MRSGILSRAFLVAEKLVVWNLLSIRVVSGWNKIADYHDDYG